MVKKTLSPHQRIVRAAKSGCGIRLTAEETALLAQDYAIQQVAADDDEWGIHREARSKD